MLAVSWHGGAVRRKDPLQIPHLKQEGELEGGGEGGLTSSGMSGRSVEQSLGPIGKSLISGI